MLPTELLKPPHAAFLQVAQKESQAMHQKERVNTGAILKKVILVLEKTNYLEQNKFKILIYDAQINYFQLLLYLFAEVKI